MKLSGEDAEQIVVRVDAETYRQLKAEAGAEERTVSQQVRLLVRRWLEGLEP